MGKVEWYLERATTANFTKFGGKIHHLKGIISLEVCAPGDQKKLFASNKSMMGQVNILSVKFILP